VSQQSFQATLTLDDDQNLLVIDVPARDKQLLLQQAALQFNRYIKTVDNPIVQFTTVQYLRDLVDRANRENQVEFDSKMGKILVRFVEVGSNGQKY